MSTCALYSNITSINDGDIAESTPPLYYCIGSQTELRQKGEIHFFYFDGTFVESTPPLHFTIASVVIHNYVKEVSHISIFLRFESHSCQIAF